ncbi:MFS general substrate transporter [Tothia fuscella]|uniref:MFS general substrate transporter n=1 Tax=Tothia fuscella TaxID=1048955 RepID=A0A9P4TT36_9PEZI|nr:MFS general substrate transporter [Tothia fuscella]
MREKPVERFSIPDPTHDSITDIEKQGNKIKDDEDRLSTTSTRSDHDNDNEEDNADNIRITPVSLSRTKSRASTILQRVTSRLTTHSIVGPGPPPDGGLQAWTQVFCAWLVIMNTWGFVNSFGAFQTYYTVILPHITPSTISWIGSAQAFLMFFLGAFSGRALDAGYFLPTVIVGIVFQLVGIFTMSLATKYWHLFLTQGVLTGIGGGIFFCPVMGLLSTYFLKKRGLALGMATTGNSIGGIIYPVIVRQLLPKIGFPWTVRVLGFFNMAALVLVVVLMKPRLPPRKIGPIIEWSAIRDIPYVLFVLGTCSLMSAVYFAFYYIASYARDTLGLSYSSSVNLVIVLNGVGLPARVLPGYIADTHTGAFNLLVPILCFNVLLLFLWLSVFSIGSFYAWTVCYGIAAGGFQGLFPTVVTSLSDDMSRAGTRLGMAFTVIAFAALVGGPIGGAIVGGNGSGYSGAIVWAACSTAGGMVLIAGARVWKYGWVVRKKC